MKKLAHRPDWPGATCGNPGLSEAVSRHVETLRRANRHKVETVVRRAFEYFFDQTAILLGAGLGLAIHLARTSVPRLRLLVPAGLDFERLFPLNPEDNPEIVVVEVSGALHYAAVDPFLAELEHRIPSSAKIVVLNLTHAHETRFTALVALERFATDLSKKGISLHLAGVADDVMRMIESSGSHLPATPAEAEPYLSLRKCLRGIEAQRTESITRSSASGAAREGPS